MRTLVCTYDRGRIGLRSSQLDPVDREVSGIDRDGRRVTIPLDVVAHWHALEDGPGSRRVVDCRKPRQRRAAP